MTRQSSTDTLVADRVDVAPRGWTVVLTASPDVARVGRAFYPARRPLRVGREPDPGAGRLALADTRMSRNHATFSVDARDRLVVVDRGSKNGTFVNAAPVDRAVIEAQDVVRMGDTLAVVAHSVEDLDDTGHDDLGIRGQSAAIVALRRAIRKLAASELSVLVEGPTGAGKELVAWALHSGSGRSGRFVPVNCAALVDTLVETALFGHRKGAYTHATEAGDGAFVSADGGTLFLDEVGEMAPGAQPKLLRALETGEITPVGASRGSRVDVRIVCATNRDLLDRIESGEFREDLYARLAGVVLRAPALSERRDDVLPLLRHFLGSELGAVSMSADFAEALLVHGWPRNVRELRKLAERLSVLHSDAARWELAMLDEPLRRRVRDRSAAPSTERVAARPSRPELIALLQRFGGNVSDVAAQVGRSRKQVYRWMADLEIPRGTGR